MKSLPLWLVIITWACLQKRQVWDIKQERDILALLYKELTLEVKAFGHQTQGEPITRWVIHQLYNRIEQIDLLANAGLVCVVQTKEE